MFAWMYSANWTGEVVKLKVYMVGNWFVISEGTCVACLAGVGHDRVVGQCSCLVV